MVMTDGTDTCLVPRFTDQTQPDPIEPDSQLERDP
jgi:hypothetical protein